MKSSIKKVSLKTQLVLVVLVAIILSFLFITLILPHLLKPFYEKNIYEILEQPLQYISSTEQQISGGTAYLVCDFTGRVYISNNFYKILSLRLYQLKKYLIKQGICEKAYSFLMFLIINVIV